MAYDGLQPVGTKEVGPDGREREWTGSAWKLTPAGGGAGAVATVGGKTPTAGNVALDTADVPDSTDKRYVTDSHLTDVAASTVHVADGDIHVPAPGTAGQVLAVNAGATAGEWINAPAGVLPADAVSPAADDGTGLVGTGTEFAREDHKHPVQTAGVTPSTAVGNLVATDVDAALTELDADLTAHVATVVHLPSPLGATGQIAQVNAPANDVEWVDPLQFGEFQGAFDASTALFPDDPPSPQTFSAGDWWVTSVGGTVDGEVWVADQDILIAAIDNPGTTFAVNWTRTKVALSPPLVSQALAETGTDPDAKLWSPERDTQAYVARQAYIPVTTNDTQLERFKRYRVSDGSSMITPVAPVLGDWVTVYNAAAVDSGTRSTVTGPFKLPDSNAPLTAFSVGPGLEYTSVYDGTAWMASTDLAMSIGLDQTNDGVSLRAGVVYEVVTTAPGMVVKLNEFPLGVVKIRLASGSLFALTVEQFDTAAAIQQIRLEDNTVINSFTVQPSRIGQLIEISGNIAIDRWHLYRPWVLASKVELWDATTDYAQYDQALRPSDLALIVARQANGPATTISDPDVVGWQNFWRSQAEQPWEKYNNGGLVSDRAWAIDDDTNAFNPIGTNADGAVWEATHVGTLAKVLSLPGGAAFYDRRTSAWGANAGTITLNPGDRIQFTQYDTPTDIAPSPPGGVTTGFDLLYVDTGQGAETDLSPRWYLADVDPGVSVRGSLIFVDAITGSWPTDVTENDALYVGTIASSTFDGKTGIQVGEVYRATSATATATEADFSLWSGVSTSLAFEQFTFQDSVDLQSNVMQGDETLTPDYSTTTVPHLWSTVIAFGAGGYTATIAAPTPLGDIRRHRVKLLNNSSGSMTVAFDPTWLQPDARLTPMPSFSIPAGEWAVVDLDIDDFGVLLARRLIGQATTATYTGLQVVGEYVPPTPNLTGVHVIYPTGIDFTLCDTIELELSTNGTHRETVQVPTDFDLGVDAGVLWHWYDNQYIQGRLDDLAAKTAGNLKLREINNSTFQVHRIRGLAYAANGYVIPTGTTVAVPRTITPSGGANLIDGAATKQFFEGFVQEAVLGMAIGQQLDTVSIGTGTVTVVNAQEGRVSFSLTADTTLTYTTVALPSDAYTVAEQNLGILWVNGETMYRQVVTWTGGGLGTHNFATPIDPTRVIKVEGMVYHAGVAWQLDRMHNSNDGSNIAINVGGAGLTISGVLGAYNPANGGVAIVTYTKP